MGVFRRFSALQRAENSSIAQLIHGRRRLRRFQCSSASRKFLNSNRRVPRRACSDVSVLFSEPKIPQSFGTSVPPAGSTVSVLFSEPKIPQLTFAAMTRYRRPASFSALQRAENSSICAVGIHFHISSKFQCSSASRKFLNAPVAATDSDFAAVSVLFSEPKIPQCNPPRRTHTLL